MTPSLISVKKLKLTQNIVKTLQYIKIKKMSEIERLRKEIREKDERIDDLLERLDRLAVAYQQQSLKQNDRAVYMTQSLGDLNEDDINKSEKRD